MPVTAKRHGGTMILMEMQEFASFPKGTERYIRRSLDVGLRRRDAISRWARSAEEAASIRAQYQAYERLDEIRALVPDDVAIPAMAPLMSPLVAVSAFDLAEGWLPSFAAYRFLYERLIGAAARPWLPAAFCSAAMLPHIHPEDRRSLLATIGDVLNVNASWSPREPRFIPEWVEKVDAAG